MESGVALLDQKKKELKMLVQIQEGLQRRRLEIANLRARSEGRQPMSDTALMVPIGSKDLQAVYDEIYPILREIHREELHILDLKDKLSRSSVAREMDAVQQGMQQVFEGLDKGNNSSTPHQLSSWADQLKNSSSITDSVMTSISEIQFSASPCKLPGQTTETLTFHLRHGGLYVLTTVSLQSRVPAIGPPTETRVNTDPYIPGLEAVVTDSLKKDQSIQQVLSHITHTIDTDILPFL